MQASAVGLVARYFSQYVNVDNRVAAAAIVFSLSPVVLFLLVQGRFVSSPTARAVKG